MQISGQICKLMAINVEIPFLFIISVKKTPEIYFSMKWISVNRIGQFWGLSDMQYSLICKLVLKYAN